MKTLLAIIFIVNVWVNFAVSLGVRLNRPNHDGWYDLLLIATAVVSALMISVFVWRGVKAL